MYQFLADPFINRGFNLVNTPKSKVMQKNLIEKTVPDIPFCLFTDVTTSNIMFWLKGLATININVNVKYESPIFSGLKAMAKFN